MQPVMTSAEIDRFLETDFPQLGGREGGYSVGEIGAGTAVLRLHAGQQHLRPGGTVSGPTLFALADVAAYVAILAHIGPVALAVTTNLSINFLRKPGPGALLGRARILKLGKRLAVVEVEITPENAGDAVAHAVATYSIPPRPEQPDTTPVL